MQNTIKLQEGYILGEMADIDYFVSKRNRIIERGHIDKQTEKVDAQLLLIVDAFKTRVETAISLGVAI